MNRNFQDIHKILNNILENYNLEKGVKEEQIFNGWEKIVGKNLSDKCIPVKIEKNLLVLKAKNNIWRNELKLQQNDLLNLIYDKIGHRIINGLKFL